MSERIQLPDIHEEAQTPLVKELVEIIERLAQRVRQQDEQIAHLKDEIAVLKGQKKRPPFKPTLLPTSRHSAREWWNPEHTDVTRSAVPGAWIPAIPAGMTGPE
jgi:hypothetical protein